MERKIIKKLVFTMTVLSIKAGFSTGVQRPVHNAALAPTCIAIAMLCLVCFVSPTYKTVLDKRCVFVHLQLTSVFHNFHELMLITCHCQVY